MVIIPDDVFFSWVANENIGHEQENIDFIYFATADTFDVCSGNGESIEFYWLSRDEIERDSNIKPHIRGMALQALKVVGI